MIITTNHMSVAELTEDVFCKWTDELEIMGSICDFYDYSWRFYPDGRLVLADSINKDVTYSDIKGGFGPGGNGRPNGRPSMPDGEMPGMPDSTRPERPGKTSGIS